MVKDNEILISVIVTSYNNAKYIKDCLDSISNQTYKNIEVIVINDGSTDNSDEICASYNFIENYTYRCLEHKGVSVARNTGLEMANGKYVMFVDGDDRLKESIIEELFDELSETNDVICCSCIAFNEDKSEEWVCHFFDGDYLFRSIEEKEMLFRQLLDSSCYQKENVFTAIGVPWGKLYKREFLLNNSLYFKPSLIRMQDNDFNMNVFFKASEVKYIDRPLYMYRVNNITSYKKAYDYRIYSKVIVERQKFYQTYIYSFSERMRIEYQKSFVSLFLISVKNIILSYSCKDAINYIKELSKEELFIKYAYSDIIKYMSFTDKIGTCLIKGKFYRLLYFLIKIKSKCSS